MRFVQDVTNAVPARSIPALPTPDYFGHPPGPSPNTRVGLAVESMKRHMTNEGWELFSGLGSAGYELHGYGIGLSLVDVRNILALDNPHTVLVQDKREWEGLTADRSRDPRMRFHNLEGLKNNPYVFKGTVLKDAQHNPEYHRSSAEEIGCHFWVVYYHKDIVYHLAPYVRREHLIRTYHTVNKDIVPPYGHFDRTSKALFSGAISNAYPMRQIIHQSLPSLQEEVEHLPHPGYHRSGCETPQYLAKLSQYKVAICTSSVYGYALRKIIEATACGCRVITDMPCDDVLPMIDNNLTRVSPTISMDDLARLIRHLCREYRPDQQKWYADCAKAYYDYRVSGNRLAQDIESLRLMYN